MTKTVASINTSTVDLGPSAPKPTAVTEGLEEASLRIWSDDRIDTGLWECGIGKFTAHRDGYSEICTLLSGRVIIAAEGEEPREFGPGDVIVMPSGWAGTWQVLEPVRKHFTTIPD